MIDLVAVIFNSLLLGVLLVDSACNGLSKWNIFWLVWSIIWIVVCGHDLLVK